MHCLGEGGRIEVQNLHSIAWRRREEHIDTHTHTRYTRWSDIALPIDPTITHEESQTSMQSFPLALIYSRRQLFDFFTFQLSTDNRPVPRVPENCVKSFPHHSTTRVFSHKSLPHILTMRTPTPEYHSPSQNPHISQFSHLVVASPTITQRIPVECSI